MSVKSTGLKPLQAASVSGLNVASRKIEVAGAIAGLAGGIAMSVVGALISFALQESVWRAPKLISTIFLGPEVLASQGFDAAPIVVGSLLHLFTSVLLGVLYAVIISRIFRVTTEYGAPLIGGLVYGLLIWLVAYFIAVPLLAPALLEVYAPSFIIQNLVYGTVVGLVYMVARPETYTYFMRSLRNGEARSPSAE